MIQPGLLTAHCLDELLISITLLLEKDPAEIYGGGDQLPELST